MSVSMTILGKRLKAARLQRGYTQEYVAEKIDFSVPHVRKIERGAKAVNLVKLGDWCDLLDVPIEWVVSGASIPANAEHNRQFGEIAKGCSPETVAIMLDVCAQIAEAEHIGRNAADRDDDESDRA